VISIDFGPGKITGLAHAEEQAPSPGISVQGGSCIYRRGASSRQRESEDVDVAGATLKLPASALGFHCVHKDSINAAA
jgi:hypothetical protein